MTSVKICGLKTPDAVDVVIEAGADFIGLVHFPKSPRHVTLEDASGLAQQARGRIRIVVLLVNPVPELVQSVMDRVAPDFLQLHGSETVHDVRAIRTLAGIPVIKAVAVSTSIDVATAKAYIDVADLILFDAKPPRDASLPGGNAITFDWSLLKGFNTDRDYMLAGGLDPENVVAAIEATGAPIVDVSSGVEKARGEKDLEKIRRFVAAVKSTGKQPYE